MYRLENNVQGGWECTGWRGMYRVEGNIHKVEDNVQGGGKCTGWRIMYRVDGNVQDGG